MIKKSDSRGIRRSLVRQLARMFPVKDPWQRYPWTVPLWVYGKGAKREFEWYLCGASGVFVNSIGDITEWLLDCRYCSDLDLFHEADYWQHPCVFEVLRKGDCEDFALWTWRKLVHLGYDTEFVAGYVQHGDSRKGHGWVLYREGGVTYLFDPVLHRPDLMIRPLPHVAAQYTPEVSVDANLKHYVYGGVICRLDQEHLEAFGATSQRLATSSAP